MRDPILHVHRLNPSGLLVGTRTVTLPMPTMVHDFILTERHVVLILGPAVFDIEAARAGKSMLQWRPDLGVRIALLPLEGGEPTWIEGDPFFISTSPTASSAAGRSSSTTCTTNASRSRPAHPPPSAE